MQLHIPVVMQIQNLLFLDCMYVKSIYRHGAATTLKPLTSEVNDTDHLCTMQCPSDIHMVVILTCSTHLNIIAEQVHQSCHLMATLDGGNLQDDVSCQANEKIPSTRDRLKLICRHSFSTVFKWLYSSSLYPCSTGKMS